MSHRRRSRFESRHLEQIAVREVTQHTSGVALESQVLPSMPEHIGDGHFFEAVVRKVTGHPAGIGRAASAAAVHLHDCACAVLPCRPPRNHIVSKSAYVLRSAAMLAAGPASIRSTSAIAPARRPTQLSAPRPRPASKDCGGPGGPGGPCTLPLFLLQPTDPPIYLRSRHKEFLR